MERVYVMLASGRKGSGYVLGRAREHSLRYRLLDEGWFCIRCQGSAGGLPDSKIKPIDLIAIKTGCVRFIQVSKRLKTISREERRELRRLAFMYGAEPVIAYKKGQRWEIRNIARRA